MSVSDGGTPEYTDTRHVTVSVVDVNSAPTLEPIADREVWEGGLVELHGGGAGQ
ncbi:MAG: hypothetical protein H7A46_08505 [Verrucomicrobiales bacterium]|nr:hypothetical protein [Verrucomicrobiales bacterium]